MRRSYEPLPSTMRALVVLIRILLGRMMEKKCAIQLNGPMNSKSENNNIIGQKES